MPHGFILLAQVLAAQAPAPTACVEALAAVPAARACAASRIGVAIAETQAEADKLLAQAVIGEARFRDAFGRAPTPYAVYAFADPATIGPAQAALRQRGLTSILPVPSAAFLTRQRERMAAARAAIPGGQVVVRRPAAASDEPRDVEDPDMVPHELGHLWYMQVFWAGAARPASDRYGSAAPDWLDEVAAILMESDTRAAIHRNRFSDGRDDDPERSDRVPPEIALARFVIMPHPVSASLPAPGTAPAGPIRVTVAPSLLCAGACPGGLSDRAQRRSAHLRDTFRRDAGRTQLRRLDRGGRCEASPADDYNRTGCGLAAMAHQAFRPAAGRGLGALGMQRATWWLRNERAASAA